MIGPLGSVVIPAHNEATVIERCLDALLDGFAPSELDVVVSCNGCTDGTADRARSSGHPVMVIETSRAGKIEALRDADKASHVFPRIYLDADVVLPSASARALLTTLRHGALAARPPVVLECSRSTWLVRRYYSARRRLPVITESLWGCGVYALSDAGRARFGEFPDVLGDDLFVDRLFTPDEILVVDSAPVVVEVPRTSASLVKILRRGIRAKNQLRATSPVLDARSSARGTARSLVAENKDSLGGVLDAATYAGFAVAARVLERLRPGDRWERDDSTRVSLVVR